MLNRTRRSLTTAGLVGAAMLVATPAWAHVTVHADNATRGASDVAVTFRTPNEEDNASTVKLQVFFPASTTPLLGVLVQPHPGWTSTVKTEKLAKPITTDDGKITEAVSEVTWTAQSTSEGLHPGESADFVVTAGLLPDAPSLTFKALQTYSDGNVVRWIEISAPGAPEPDHPAPVLDLAAATPDTPSPSASPTVAPSSPAATATTNTASSKSSSDGVGRGLAIAALVVALLGVGLSLRRRRS